MRHTLLLARRYLGHHPWRSSVLVVGLALTFFLPLAVELLVTRFEASLVSRSLATPAVIGAPGSRYDLVLSSLYFEGRTPQALRMQEVERLRADHLVVPIPLLVRGSAAGRPLVGVTHEYYHFRGLVPERGELPVFLGECVLGARVAAELELGPGDPLDTDRGSLYDLGGAYPLRLRVVGVLAAARTPDDGAIFVDLHTAWIADGLGHGHGAAAEQQDEQVLVRRADGSLVLNASLVEYQEITPQNADRFHLHAERADLPLTGLLLDPVDRAALTIVKGRYGVRSDVQLLVPAEVMGELMGFLFRAKVIFDTNTALVGVATALFLGVIVALSMALRRRERVTLFKLGCARSTVLRLMGVELAILLVAGAALASVLALVFVAVAERSLSL
ncbi:MAG: hypothetical protein V3T22_09135 [Planctomycetota bacterium]